MNLAYFVLAMITTHVVCAGSVSNDKETLHVKCTPVSDSLYRLGVTWKPIATKNVQLHVQFQTDDTLSIDHYAVYGTKGEFAVPFPIKLDDILNNGKMNIWVSGHPFERVKVNLSDQCIYKTIFNGN